MWFVHHKQGSSGRSCSSSSPAINLWGPSRCHPLSLPRHPTRCLRSTYQEKAIAFLARVEEVKKLSVLINFFFQHVIYKHSQVVINFLHCKNNTSLKLWSFGHIECGYEVLGSYVASFNCIFDLVNSCTMNWICTVISRKDTQGDMSDEF